jgi:hypothetical protein
VELQQAVGMAVVDADAGDVSVDTTHPHSAAAEGGAPLAEIIPSGGGDNGAAVQVAEAECGASRTQALPDAAETDSATPNMHTDKGSEPHTEANAAPSMHADKEREPHT